MRIKRWSIWFTVLCAAQILFLFVGSSPNALSAEIKPVTWRLQAVYSPGGSVYDLWVLVFAEEVNKRGKGIISITPYPSGSLIKVNELFDGVSKGVVDCAVAASLYWTGALAEAALEMGLPFSYPEDPAITNELFYKYKNGAFNNLINTAYNEKGIQLVNDIMVTGYGLMMKGPVNKLDDLKGKKVRTFGVFSALLKGLGASPTSIDPAEQYMALRTGVIDGTLYPIHVYEAYKFYEVADTIVLPRLQGTCPVAFLANLKKWNTLSPEQKKVVLDAVKLANETYVKKVWPWEDEVIAKSPTKFGTKVVTFSNTDVTRMKEVAKPIWKSAAEKSPRCGELYKIMTDFLASKKISFPQ
jgi:TRAP-type C4-dicarboxylate transport system substrate-binding protein